MKTLKSHQAVSLLALGTWFISLALPTLDGGDTPKLGYFVFREGALGILFFFLAPLHELSWCTNIGFFMVALYVLFQDKLTEAKVLLRFLYWALVINVCVGLVFGRASYQGPGRLVGLLALPGFYVWILSFVVLTLAVRIGTRK